MDKKKRGKKNKGKDSKKGPPQESSKDERFSSVLSNPIYRSVPKSEKKVNIDKRFQSMFHDESFKLKYKVDKRGRPVNLTAEDNLKKYYNLEEDDDDDDEKEEVKSEKDESESEEEIKEEKDDKGAPLSEGIRKKLRSSEIDYARGEGILLSGEESEDDDSDSSSADDDEDDGVDHEWGELDKDAPKTEESTKRLALCNMDWDRIKSADLMVLFTSFLPSGGVLSKTSIYPSEYGKKRMEEEEVRGPLELQHFKKEHNSDEEKDDERNQDDSDLEEGSNYNREKLREYQLNRLRYFYAVLEFDSPESAEKVYSECDGMEYESSSAKIDLRYIPDEMEFDEVPRDVCDAVPDASKYRPKFFTTTALQQIKVACTWDETDPTRKEIIQKVLDKKDKIEDEDLRAYLASSSSESEDETEAVAETKPDSKKADPIAMYRNLLQSIEKKEDNKKDDMELEITWGVGLKQKAENLVKKKSKEEEIKKLTPWEEQITKQKEKRRQKKHAGKSTEQEVANSDSNSDDDGEDQEDDQQPFSDDDVDVDMNDPFFKEFTQKVKKKKGGKAKKGEKESDDMPDKNADELELLVLDNDDSKKHFNFKKIIDSESMSKSKKKRKFKRDKKQNVTGGVEGKADDFQVDVEDPRFSALFTSHKYNIDPSEPNFKKTKAMETIIQAKQKRRLLVSSSDDSSKIPEKRKSQAELSYLVNSVKNKTKSAKSNPSFKHKR